MPLCGNSIRKTNPLQDPAAWDDLVSSHPDATFFHGSAWARVLHEAYGFTPLYLVARAEESKTENRKSQIKNPPSSVLPLMQVRSPLTGCRGVSLPFTDACPPLLSPGVPLQPLLGELAELGRACRWNYWECRGLKQLPSGVAASLSFYGHILDLSVGEKPLFENLKAPVRTAIRKAEQAGVQVEISNSLPALRTFYTLHCKTRRKHGLPPQPFRFFGAIHRHILDQGLGQVVIARIGPTPIAANVFVYFRSQAIFKFGASDEAFQELRASNLVMWHGIQACVRQGCRSLHFGRTSLAAEGLRRFKLGWGASEEQIAYLRYDYRKTAFIRVEDAALGWHNRLLGRLPMPLLRLLGAALYRHIA